MPRGTLSNSVCGRCGCTSKVRIGSFFDTNLICSRCQEIEKNHPEHARAKEVELQAVMNGNYNYPGIGVPPGLIAQCQEARREAESQA